jgi:glucosamine kinase
VGVVVVGIDAGGTKTVCRLADARGRVLAEARGPGANLQNAGELEVERVLHQVLTEVLVGDDWPAAVCLGIAGVDRATDAAIVGKILRRIAPRSRVVVVNDALVALEAGVPGAPGVVLIAGTGSIAYGRNREGWAARAGGWGYLLGDEGSGYWLGRQALRAVVRSADGRGPHTLLTARVLTHFGIARTQDLVREIYDGSFAPATVAAVASQVEGAAEDGDEIALHLIDTGARELGLAALSVCTRLKLSRGPVVLAGGMFTAAPRLRQRVVSHLTGRSAGMVVTPLEGPPVAGAVSLALAEAAGTLRLPAYLDT